MQHCTFLLFPQSHVPLDKAGLAGEGVPALIIQLYFWHITNLLIHIYVAENLQ
jgi:hypothetical protein